QPSHAIGDLFFAPDRLGPNRLDGAYAWRSIIDAGGIIAAGSDAPVERGDPLIEFYAAVVRRGLDGTQTEDWRPGEAVTREEALKMFTAWPAYASFQENLLGTIEPGKRADFTVFSKDIMTVAEEEILTAKPMMTVVDGEIVFRAE
ncbi:MAG: amidohydrolase family protein, partial [Marinicaulis sp.]|nr:amidohydrolase family protein [Marinicaulis sp.]